MSNEIKVIATTAIIGTQLSIANASNQIPLKDLNRFGIDSEAVSALFKENINVNLNPNELLKVTYENEGKNIQFETLDNYSVTVAIGDTRTSPNKNTDGGFE